MNDTTMARIFLADDHPAVRQGLAMLLTQHGHAVCGEAESRAQALAMIDARGADLAIVDLSLGEDSGLDLLPDLAARDVPVLVYSMHEDPETIERAFAAGAAGYVSKREISEALLEGVGEVLAGRSFIGQRAAQALAGRLVGGEKDARTLSEQEKQVLRLLGQGDSVADIAVALNLSARTVETYCARIREKLGLGGMKALRKHAIGGRGQA